jgi:hypothetical protein
MANRNGSIETAVISALLGACLILGGCGGGSSVEGGPTETAEMAAASVIRSTPGASPTASTPTQVAAPAPTVTTVQPTPLKASAPDASTPSGPIAVAEDPKPTASEPAPTYVVATSGNDRNPGTVALPLATLQRAIDLAQAGDTILVRAGVYAVAGATRVAGKRATATAPFTIIGESGAVLRAATEAVPGVWRGVLEIENSSWIIVRGIAVENSSFFGFRVQYSDNITLQGNRSTISLGSGIYARGVTTLRVDSNDVSRFCDRNIFGASPIAGCQEGISLDSVDGFDVVKNLVHDAPQTTGVGPGGGEGIDIKNGSSNGVVAFNSVWNLVQIGIYIDGWALGAQNVVVHGNRVWNTYMGIVVASEMSGVVKNVAVHNNIIRDVGVHGIEIADFKAGKGGDGLRTEIAVYNNTIINAGVKESKPPYYSLWVTGPFPDRGTGIAVSTTNVTSLRIFDNIISGSKTTAIQLKPEVRVNARVETNLIWPLELNGATNAYRGTRPILAAPAFVSPATGDWHLSANSPARSSGSGGGAASVDADNLPRPSIQLDLGALAYRGS